MASLLVVGLLVLGGLVLASPSPVRAATAGKSIVTIMATDALSFAPSSISVPTLSVELEVENLGTTDHWFTLSDRVNQTAPSDTNPATNASGTFFAANEVLVDESLPHGTTLFANVTFPSAGNYEFICRVHFPSMVGELDVGVPPASGSSSTPVWEYGAAAGVVLIVVIAAVAVVMMRRRAPPAAGAPTPK